MEKYILAIDQGTTSSRALLFDRNGNAAYSAQKEFEQIYPFPGWVEHDAWGIWNDVRQVIGEVMQTAGITAEQIAGIGITDQRETTVIWDKATGKPICNAIVWQCRRTSDRAKELKDSEWGQKIYDKTGLVPDAYFSATKIEWILDHIAGAKEKAKRGELLFGTIDCWLLYCLTEGKVHATDMTNASRTMLFNIHTREWDEELLTLFDIPRAMMPEVKECSGIFGYATAVGDNIPVSGMAGDQQASLYGQGCFGAGEVKNTYGTGCFLLMNTGEKAIRTDAGLLTTVAMAKNGRVQYALEGSVYIGGAVVQWLRDELCLISSAAETEECALAVEDTAGVYIVPAFTGLGAPYWDMYARGTMFGLTRGAKKNHIVRAALESIVYQVEDLLGAMKEASGIDCDRLLVDGGACVNNFLMQFQADVSDITVCRPKIIETTVRGAAFLAGLAVGFWKDEKELLSLIVHDRDFVGKMPPDKRQKLLSGWHKAVSRSTDWQEH